jgi:hypothetical protein
VFQAPRDWLKDAAPKNMKDMSLTLDASQPASGWLKDVAKVNIKDMSVTLDVSQVSMGWLKFPGIPTNMNAISVTLDTSQFPMGWLKAVALSNMERIVSALDKSQPEISSLKFTAAVLKRSPSSKSRAAKRKLKSRIMDTSQTPIGQP